MIKRQNIDMSRKIDEGDAGAEIDKELQKPNRSSRFKHFLFPLVLFIPLGLIMDLMHELGHAVWGIVIGGRLAYMQIAYLEVYPRFTLNPEFRLGYVVVTGLHTEFENGLFLLGGSLTTNIVAWLIALILFATRHGRKTRMALLILGIFGVLDLPLYVLFPQIGLRHWLFLGGATPEPLIGAGKMGIPDVVFYALVTLTTVGLTALYTHIWRDTEDQRGTLFEKTLSKRGTWVEKVIPGLILITLWLDGWFYPLLLLPILYVILVEKKTLGWLGFQRRGLRLSAVLGFSLSVALSAVYYPIFLQYLPLIRGRNVDLHSVFTDVFWYPLYEEIAYRGFALAHFAEPSGFKPSARNLLANITQSLLFLSIHGHHIAAGIPMVLVPVFMLGLLNGLLFLKTRNIYGCLISHSVLNSFALILLRLHATV